MLQTRLVPKDKVQVQPIDIEAYTYYSATYKNIKEARDASILYEVPG